jgi:septum formation topological specificity factor MinE
MKKNDVKQFARLVEKSERAWKPTKEELQIIIVGTRQDERELKIETLITASKRVNLISLLHEYVNVFAQSYGDISSLDTNIIVQKVPLNEESIPMKRNYEELVQIWCLR